MAGPPPPPPRPRTPTSHPSTTAPVVLSRAATVGLKPRLCGRKHRVDAVPSPPSRPHTSKSRPSTTAPVIFDGAATVGLKLVTTQWPLCPHPHTSTGRGPSAVLALLPVIFCHHACAWATSPAGLSGASASDGWPNEAASAARAATRER